MGVDEGSHHSGNPVSSDESTVLKTIIGEVWFVNDLHLTIMKCYDDDDDATTMMIMKIRQMMRRTMI